jgi:hypothetical protein
MGENGSAAATAFVSLDRIPPIRAQNDSRLAAETSLRLACFKLTGRFKVIICTF